MFMKIVHRLAFAALLAFSAGSLQAGDEPLYQSAPSWVVTTDVADWSKVTPKGNMVLSDMQGRIDGGLVWTYSDFAVKLDTPEALTQFSSITMPWLPDKGDLIIHELSIIRDGKTIDALASGKKFTVLRREQMLEQLQLTGMLSATMAVEGLQVGDIVRLRASVTGKDDALAGKAQASIPLFADPLPIPKATYRLSWRTSDKAKWKLIGDGGQTTITTKGDFTEMTIAVPLPKQPDMPYDAPERYRKFPLLEATTFSGWDDVSKTMAPLYATKDLIADGSALAEEVGRIKSATTDPLTRAAAALQLVQDKIRYLAVDMNGGNYVPQAPAKTWELRYGDCKAKTLLLLSLLRAMDIDAEPVLAHIGWGDMVADRLPSAAAFNHILVHATINGESLYLDGTGLGSRLADIKDIPPFGYVLPVKDQGAELIKLPKRAPARPSLSIAINADESSSMDLPSVIDLVMTVRGSRASAITQMTSALADKEKREALENFLQPYVGEAQYETITSDSNLDDATVTIKARGAFNTGWKTEDRKTERWLSRVPTYLEFSPDRARPAWTNIPVKTDKADLMQFQLRLRLPDGGKGYTLEGDGPLDTSIAGYQIKRSVDLADGIVTVNETLAPTGEEIQPAQIAAERDRVATVLARSPKMVAPSDASRRWSLAGLDPKNASQLKAIETIYAKAKKDADAENLSPYNSSASFHLGIGDHKAAAADYGKMLELAPDIETYLLRSWARESAGDTAGALADAEAARSLDPSSIDAISRVASLTAERGDVAKGSAMLDERIAIGGKTRFAYRMEKVQLLGEFGDPQAALTEIDALLAEKPGSPELLNARCWIKATRNIMVDTALKDCTQAMELSDSTAPILDSRAFVWLRLGRHEDALRDLDAALLQSPSLGPSRYLRSVVLKAMGRSAEAASDLAASRKLSPSIERQYARFGLP